MKKDEKRYVEVKESFEAIRELGLPDHLQDTALRHLLSSTGHQDKASLADGIAPRSDGSATTGELRAFVSTLKMDGAVEIIPVLFFWAKENEGRTELNERDIIELYRRTNLRAPKNVGQSFRDLASKRYLRLESVEGKNGYYRLSRAGEDVVRFDIIGDEK